MKHNIMQWPAVYVRVRPETHARMEDAAEARSLPVTAIVREALEKVYGKEEG